MLMNCESGMDIKTDTFMFDNSFIFVIIGFNSYITANEP